VLLKKSKLPRRPPMLRRLGGSEIGGKKIPNDYLSIDCPT
jgi:hypothetical protein